ncbi:chromosome segregation protein SMC [Methylocapsa sp. S129]|uniref:chromosome segregation protein SMC n=1 Tax=Methylocapsa sp. S129 TaxID=1641869 RepID=UPI00131E9833|nr:chromosome segregation protein SMC [Methylocapsa sp. S129]
MIFDRLRLAGFKSFCDQTDFKIEAGLTGIVGPNGCGKSNLVEALRWVMGESSYKSMRASGMDDVIFSGSGNRPARNIAEVGLVLDNSDRKAPAAFNDSEVIEVTRRIERESGSTYRVNGREVRAKDVQLLFADASTGARSPALVRQGQIGEIIAAKPQARRLILEEAAGVSGLHSRRHEAELRLKGAEDNLLRLEDVLKQIDAQIDGLKRQARQAQRYKGLAADIRRNEALALHIAWRECETKFTEAQRRLEADVREVAERTRVQAEAARAQAVAAAALAPLREEEARAGAALHRLVLAREALEGEERRAKERTAELERRIGQLANDLAREAALIDDAAGVSGRLAEEEAALAGQSGASAELTGAAQARLSDGERALQVSEARLAEAQAALSDLNARRNALGAALAEETRRLARFTEECATIERERAGLQGAGADQADLEDQARSLEALNSALGQAETDALEAEAAHGRAREAETRARAPLSEAERKAQRLETEVGTLTKLLGSASGGLWPTVLEQTSVAKGYEAALGAALGDDLDASTNTSAPAHWADAAGEDADPALPGGVEPLAGLVQAPAALRRRLAQIGIVTREQGRALRPLLQVGQRLVSREGDLWRWDGFVSAAEAPTPAARRLVEKNRLGDLSIEAEQARQAAEIAKAEAARVQAALRDAASAEAGARQRAREARGLADAAREKMAASERRRAQVLARLSALDEAAARAQASRDEAAERRRQAEAALAGLIATDELTLQLERARAQAAQERAECVEARAAVQSIARESEARERRRQAIAADLASWRARREKAQVQIVEIEDRQTKARAELETLAEAPTAFLQQRRALIGEIDAAEAARKEASDQRAATETGLAEADRAARAALEAMSVAREARAASEERVEGARQRREALLHTIQVELEAEPLGLAALAGLKTGETPPDHPAVERKLESLKQERERLGAVNLRADDELVEVEASRDRLTSERDDLTEAIKRLRQAIQNLNKEGRERLLAAFDVVNKHFGELFGTLFEGGSAELQLIESDDPLEAGLELLARPPGKRPQVLTLLSGGEQALTAMSLIFAVFLTNPSPICVLDEVDAPLDDSNVERFCDLLEEMRKRSDTRFVTITHNPITMARMDRLFGVTMAERGVSQIVSVDLAAAERFLEAS